MDKWLKEICRPTANEIWKLRMNPVVLFLIKKYQKKFVDCENRKHIKKYLLTMEVQMLVENFRDKWANKSKKPAKLKIYLETKQTELANKFTL